MSQTPGVPTTDVKSAHARATEPTDGPAPLIVDVRERDEFAGLRVPGAALVPLSGFADAWQTLPRDRPLLMMCAAGSRSLAAADLLIRNGFTDVTNVAGGIIAWQANGLPVTSGPPAPGEGDLSQG